VYDSYGPALSPSALLLDYGFVDATNRNDVLDVPCAEAAAPRGPRNRALLEALAALQGRDAVVAVGAEGPDQAAVLYMRAALATDAELVRAGWRIKATAADADLACRVMGALAEPASEPTEAAVLAGFERLVLTLLGRYPTSLQADEAELARPDTPPLRAAALRALASEKRALLGAQAAVATWQARLNGGCFGPDLYEFGECGQEASGSDSEGEEGQRPEGFVPEDD
jgi:hypothetical protein